MTMRWTSISPGCTANHVTVGPAMRDRTAPTERPMKKCKMCKKQRLLYWRKDNFVIIMCEDCHFTEPMHIWDPAHVLVNMDERVN